MPEKHLPPGICHPRSNQKYQTTPHHEEIDLKTHRFISHSQIHFIWRNNEKYWEPHHPILEYLPAKIVKK